MPQREALDQGPLPTHVACPPRYTMGEHQNGNMNGDTPFRDTPFCFHLAGSTNNLFPSRRAGLDSLKVGFSMFSRKGLCELQADRICTQKAAPRPHKHRRKMSQNPEDSSAAKSQHPHRVEDLHCRDSRVTGQQEGHPPGTPHPWLGAS